MVCAARLGFSAPRPCGRVGWKPFPLHLQSSVVVARAFVFPFRCGVLRCLHVERQRFALSAALPDLPSAWTRSPAESRTLSLRRVSRRPVLPHQSWQRRCRPPLQLWASLSGSPIPLPKRAPHRRASEPAHGSLKNSLAALLGAVSGLASKCCPPLPMIPLALSGSSTSAHLQPVVLVVMALCF